MAEDQVLPMTEVVFVDVEGSDHVRLDIRGPRDMSPDFDAYPFPLDTPHIVVMGTVFEFTSSSPQFRHEVFIPTGPLEERLLQAVPSDPMTIRPASRLVVRDLRELPQPDPEPEDERAIDERDFYLLMKVDFNIAAKRRSRLSV